MNPPYLGARVPQKWISRFETISQQTGRSVDDLVREAIAQYLGVEAELVVAGQIDDLKAQISRIAKKVDALYDSKTELRQVSARLTTLERILGTAALSQPQTPPETAEEEDEFDEPDEVLIDFLPPDRDLR